MMYNFILQKIYPCCMLDGNGLSQACWCWSMVNITKLSEIICLPNTSTATFFLSVGQIYFHPLLECFVYFLVPETKFVHLFSSSFCTDFWEIVMANLLDGHLFKKLSHNFNWSLDFVQIYIFFSFILFFVKNVWYFLKIHIILNCFAGNRISCINAYFIMLTYPAE